MKLKAFYKELIADTYTPVSAYLKLRDIFPNSYLLESADRHSQENATSYICFNPIATVWVDTDLSFNYQNFLLKQIEKVKDLSKKELINKVDTCFESFAVENANELQFKNGFFGMLSFEGVSLFEDIDFSPSEEQSEPLLHYTLFKNVLEINHFSNTARIYCFSEDDSHNLIEIEELLSIKTYPSYRLNISEERSCNNTESAFKNAVSKGKEFCKKGDVFQVVLSREFQRDYQGDEFNLYRALRAVNPSPYMFYFDLAHFKFLGASPEAQIKSEGGNLVISPIAGTIKRSGNDDLDRELAKKLSEDPKENAEHTMLVDLARNDLSKVANQVEVESYREIHYYSHVIHLVSKVIGKAKAGNSPLEILGASFPAGTLSGAPKYRAMEIIRDLEQKPRGLYGGTVGFIGLDGSINQAIFIRSAVCRSNKLIYRAGAGVVDASTEEGELAEVYHKVGAIEKAIDIANRNFR
ncbi:anthranilate synthase component I family protein [Luteibaculum oceani]|uniref:Anthranilate synthase component 1 n=1 Tax=Luteibaculum oceani TaxID=1294296 RepID=A0A5C6V071_9FLAO|nr:anthranilate synthase component I family protein [Luteibaculum oceani]TXC78559.1 anthranilate synthase component I family protein [Luteibaculum oceani]